MTATTIKINTKTTIQTMVSTTILLFLHTVILLARIINNSSTYVHIVLIQYNINTVQTFFTTVVAASSI